MLGPEAVDSNEGARVSQHFVVTLTRSSGTFRAKKARVRDKTIGLAKSICSAPCIPHGVFRTCVSSGTSEEPETFRCGPPVLASFGVLCEQGPKWDARSARYCDVQWNDASKGRTRSRVVIGQFRAQSEIEPLQRPEPCSRTSIAPSLPVHEMTGQPTRFCQLHRDISGLEKTARHCIRNVCMQPAPWQRCCVDREVVHAFAVAPAMTCTALAHRRIAAVVRS